MSALPQHGGRPYRSHLQPACVPCRKRKSRCRLDDANQTTCLTCQFHGSQCTFPPASEETPRPRRKILSRAKQPSAAPLLRVDSGQLIPARRQDKISAGPDCPPETPFSNSTAPSLDASDESHVIGPVLGHEAQLIANYLMSEPAFHTRAARLVVPPGQSVPGQRPIMFNTVRKHPLGYSAGQTIAAQRCQVVEKLVDPYCNDLIDIYFEKVHKCFPLVDEASFRDQYDAERERISPALLSSVYAQGVIFWRVSSLSSRHCPDLRFVWNQTTEALYSEMQLSPGISTVIAVLLNISGRPLTSMLGNGVLLGSAISLAHSLGLNRGCFDWDISPAEKCLRTRIWWAIVIYDKWSSVTYGTPPQLKSNQHDVPVPSPADILGPNEDAGDHEAAAVFIGLITLTEVLDTFLEQVFDLRQGPHSPNGTPSYDVESRLAQWEDSLPHELRRAIIRGTDLSIPGSANLRLSYLYVRLLGRKLALDYEKSSQTVAPSSLANRHIYARQAAEDVVIMVQELDDRALSDFWLSYNAFALSSTVAFLLRSALESECYQAGGTQGMSLKLARDMIAALQSHGKRMGWDLANICLAQYSDIVERLATSPLPLDAASELHQFLVSDVPAVDELFPSLWDMFQ